VSARQTWRELSVALMKASPCLSQNRFDDSASLNAQVKLSIGVTGANLPLGHGGLVALNELCLNLGDAA